MITAMVWILGAASQGIIIASFYAGWLRLPRNLIYCTAYWLPSVAEENRVLRIA